MAIKATKIRLKSGASGDDERSIAQIYLTNTTDDRFYDVQVVINTLNDGTEITVAGYPDTYLEVVHENNNTSDYVRSQANGTKNDNLLNLPQE